MPMLHPVLLSWCLPHCCITGILDTLTFSFQAVFSQKFSSCWTSYVPSSCLFHPRQHIFSQLASQSTIHNDTYSSSRLEIPPPAPSHFSRVDGQTCVIWLKHAFPLSDGSIFEYLCCAIVSNCDQNSWSEPWGGFPLIYNKMQAWGKESLILMSCWGLAGPHRLHLNACHLQLFN